MELISSIANQNSFTTILIFLFIDLLTQGIYYNSHHKLYIDIRMQSVLSSQLNIFVQINSVGL